MRNLNTINFDAYFNAVNKQIAKLIVHFHCFFSRKMNLSYVPLSAKNSAHHFSKVQHQVTVHKTSRFSGFGTLP